MITLTVNDRELNFEHSLVSLSEWEAEHEKPFFSPTQDSNMSTEEMMDYFECMLVSPRKYKHLVMLLSPTQQLALAEYIQKKRSATTIREIQNSKGPRENVTSELIYYWLVAFKIPFQPTEKWHLNRILMLVKVCGAKQAPPPKKATPAQRAQQAQSMRELNERRLAERGTKG